MATAQVAFPSLTEVRFRQRMRRIDRYITEYKGTYAGMAALITPDHASPDAVWCRLAFAILSAHVPFSKAVAALDYARQHQGHVDAAYLARWSMTPAKAEYLNALPTGEAVLGLLGGPCHGAGETWATYRLRLREVRGLGLAKASFAASLLYPLDSDLACLDTHMQQVYLGHTRFRDLTLATYLSVEAKIRTVARRHGINTFLAQWLIWDCARGTIESHAIFPGSHKTEEPDWVREV